MKGTIRGMDQINWMRQFREDARDYPATMAMGSLWIAVWAAMLVNQTLWGAGLSWNSFCLGTQNGLGFGAMTLRDLDAGDVWRLLTSTFVHFGIFHISLNLFALYQLGCLVESWYGPGPFLAIYVLTGAGGNLISAIIRHMLGSDPRIISAGGSTVVMGLVALCAVVGWFERSRIGNHLRNQMLLFIFITFAIGFGSWAAGVHKIDNWGHAGGSVMGAILGFGNPALARLGQGMRSRVTAWASVLVIASAGAAQVSDGRAAVSRVAEQGRMMEESQRKLFQERQRAIIRIQEDEQVLRRLDEIRKVYKIAAIPRVIMRGALVRELPPRPQRATPPADALKPSPKPETKPDPSRSAAAPPVIGPPLSETSDAKPATAEPSSEISIVKKAAPPAPIPSVAPPASPAQSRMNPFMIDPEQELRLVILNSSLRLLTSLATMLDSGENSLEFRRAQFLLARTMSDFPTIEEVREFDDHLFSMIENVKKDREAARQQITGPKQKS